MNTPTSSFPVISGCLIAGLIFIVFIILLYRFYRFLFRNKAIFGLTLKTRVISLGITSLIFTTGVSMIFFFPLQVLFQSLMNFYTMITDLKQSIGGGSDNMLMRVLSTTFGNLNEQLQAFKVGPVIVAIAAWSLIGELVESYNGTEETRDKPKNNALRQNIVLGLIFVLSIYLSFAAIITVPYFTETTAPSESKEEFFKTQLDEIQKNESAKTTLLTKPAAPEFIMDTVIMKKLESIPNHSVKESLKKLYTEANEDYLTSISSRKTAFDCLDQEKIKYTNKLGEEETRMLSTYSGEISNLKAQLRISFRNALVEHYKTVSEVSYMRIEQANDAILAADEKLRADLVEFKHGFGEFVNRASGPDSMKVNLPNETNIISLERDYYYGDDLYLTSPEFPIAVPNIPSPGDDLGIFKDIAQWLIKPLSMSLVLIVGMLGFGLFGSVISTFVKEARDPVDKEGMIISDVTGVIIRGVSAAVVIFLGVKGGLAIFSSGEGDPNPYALFFTCLVGAVYSEKIWAWAKEKLSSNLKTSNTGTPEDGNTLS